IRTVNPCGLLPVESTAREKHMNMDMPGETSAKSVHDHHKAREIVFVVEPIRKRLINNAIKAIKIWFSVNAEVVQKLMRGRKDNMLVLTFSKERGIRLNPDIGLPDSAGGAEA